MTGTRHSVLDYYGQEDEVMPEDPQWAKFKKELKRRYHPKVLVPCLNWIPKYNFGWLLSDICAGLTIAMMVTPQ